MCVEKPRRGGQAVALVAMQGKRSGSLFYKEIAPGKLLKRVCNFVE